MKRDRRRPPLLPRAIALLALAIAGTIWILQVHQGRPSRRERPSPVLQNQDVTSTPASAERRYSSIPEPPEVATDPPPSAESHPLAMAFGTPAIPPEKESAVLLEMLRGYRDLFGAYPTAEDNPSVMRKITQARKGIRLFPSSHPRISADGSLLDAWGTPFFFHFLSHRAMEVRSAGADRELFTQDDIVAADPSMTADRIP